MATKAEIEKALAANEASLKVQREKVRDLDNERVKLVRELRRIQLSALVGETVLPAYRGDYPDWDAAGGTLVEVRRTRCTIQVNSGTRWNCPVYDVLPASEAERQGYSL